MYVRLLGPVAVGPDRMGVLGVSGQIAAAVLAHLALAGGRWVSAESIMEAVWDAPPGSARNAIQVAVSRLRKQFGADLVLSGPRGYRVDADRVRVDWLDAERLVAGAREHLDQDRAEDAEGTARAAAALFAGEPLMGLHSAACDAMRVRAHDLLAAALLVQSRALLRLGRPERAIETVQPLCDADPLDEPVQLLRMEALAASGRLAAALAAYEHLRAQLADQLGVDPSPAAQAMFARLLQAGSAGPDPTHSPPLEPRQWTIGLAPSRATAYRPRTVRSRLPERGRVVLTGPSGIGKTQIAAGVFADSVDDLRVWVSAGSTETVVAGYARAAETVGRVDPSRPAEELARLFLGWLASTDRRWLVVLDDVGEPADLRGWWPPDRPRGLVLATTQRRTAELSGEGRLVIDVGHYTDAEAETYLTDRLGTEASAPADGGRWRSLATGLGRHPLALGMAAAVIIDQAITIGEYLDLLASAPLSASLPSDVRADGYPRSLHAAWSLAVDRADQHSGGVAHRLLSVLAVLDPVGVPRAVIGARGVQTDLDSGGTAPIDQRRSAYAVLRTLHQVSLTDHQPALEPRSIRTHALVARFARERSTHSERIDALRVAAAALVEVWATSPMSNPLSDALRGSASTVESLDAELAHQALWPGGCDQLPPLLAAHAQSLVDAEQYAIALPYLTGVRSRAEERLGPYHGDTLRLHTEIARVRTLTGDGIQVERDLRSLAARLPGEVADDDPGRLTILATLGWVRFEIGSPMAAVRDLAAVLPALERVLGPDHQETLSALEALGDAHAEAGEFEMALRSYDTLVVRCRRVFGAEHRRTLVAEAYRAYWLGLAGDPSASVAAHRRLIPMMEHVLGQTDPSTLRARNNHAYFVADDAEAAREFARLLRERSELLGPDHPDTLSTRANLANRRGLLGDAVGAARELETLIADQTRVLGAEHRYTLLCRGYRARWLIAAGDLVEGSEVGRAAVADLERVLGADHLFTRRINGYLANGLPS